VTVKMLEAESGKLKAKAVTIMRFETGMTAWYFFFALAFSF
jgi:hypothetical protein